MKFLLAIAALALLAFAASAAPLALPAPPQAGIEQHIGAQLPSRVPLLDERGRTVNLDQFFRAARPVLLVPGYYSCPELCGLVMHGVLQAVHDAHADVSIVRVSIDPLDTPAIAAAQRERDLAYADFLGGPHPALHLLTGTSAATRPLLQALGYRFESAHPDDAPAARFAHPAAVIVATPDRRVSRYFMGVRIEPDELRTALDAAAQGGVGTWTGQLALLCAHFDPRMGRHSEAVMNIARAVGLLTLAGLAGWCWRRRSPRGAAS
jgi:protein SCO1